MTLSQLLKDEGLCAFAAVALENCSVIKERLLSGLPDNCFAVMTVLPYPARAEIKSRFAAFSVIPDYHIFYKNLEDKLALWFGERYPEASFKVFADHSPIDERLAACTAGLGVIGDNGLFISEKYGSFVFLGEIICTLSKEQLTGEGIPVRFEKTKECPHCGACRIACPTGAAGGDKSLCISHLTQKKGDLSDTEKSMIKDGGYVWGCDICAAACPMNRECLSDSLKDEDGTPLKYSGFFTSGIISPQSCEDIDAMNDEEYARYPFSWRKKEILKRNFKLFE